MNIEAMNQLLRVLHNVSRDVSKRVKFNLNDWMDVNNSDVTKEAGLQNDVVTDVTYIPHTCGCTACACGYAGLDPWFREQGFKTTPSGNVMFDDDFDGWYAVEKFFGINTNTAYKLFQSSSYLTEQQEDDGMLVRVEAVIARVIDIIEIGEEAFMETDYVVGK